MPQDHPSAFRASLVTVSYRGDFELARDLCLSADEFLDDQIEHVLVVPRRDVKLFSSLTSTSRRIVPVEDVLPPDYRKLPLPQKVGFGRFQRRIREIWLARHGLVRGWVVQQIVKLSAPNFASTDIIVFADSDIVLIAPLTLDRLATDERVRLYRVPDATKDSQMHIEWHDASSRLLGLAEEGFTGADYIGNLITWRAENIIRLQARLTDVGGKPWHHVIARQRAFSEYILYGLFIQRIVGEVESGHAFTSEDLVHAGWFYDLSDPAGVAAFSRGRKPGQVGVAIQSTEPLSIDERRRLIGTIKTTAAPPSCSVWR